MLTAMIALRALVPVGYMLSLPGDGSIDWALHLCPAQNRSLDLGTLQAGVPGEHREHKGNAAGDRSHLTVSSDCTAWLDSATPAFAGSATLAAAGNIATTPFFNPGPFVSGRLCRHAGQARAPPASV